MTLESLRPRQAANIMDLVAAAGVDVSPWAVKANGERVRNPRANPQYCYEWAFGGGSEPSVLCVWCSSLREDGGSISYEDNIRQHAHDLDRLADAPFTDAKVRLRARDQAKRARKFDSLVQRAYRTASPIRFVLLVGKPKVKEELGMEAAQVDFRRLDEIPWFVHRYDDDGNYTVVRGMPRVMIPEGPKFVDQFSAPEAPERRTTAGSAFAREGKVRQEALERARGTCERCGSQGFKMANGAIYLETHHVVPLSEGGLDVIWNVVAVCPNEHRYAHHGVNRSQVRKEMLAFLEAKHPEAREAIARMSGAAAAEPENE